jgi:hypothetical protein
MIHIFFSNDIFIYFTYAQACYAISNLCGTNDAYHHLGQAGAPKAVVLSLTRPVDPQFASACNAVSHIMIDMIGRFVYNFITLFSSVLPFPFRTKRVLFFYFKIILLSLFRVPRFQDV